MVALAERQHGVVSQSQGIDLGVDRRAQQRLVRAGAWERITGTVLRRSGSPATWHQAVVAAVLDAGDGSFASHRTAAALWGLPGFDQDGIEITRGGRRHSRHPDIAFQHRPVRLPPAAVTTREGIPVGSVALTIFQLASVRVPLGRLAAVTNLVVNRSPGTLRSLHELLPIVGGRGVTGTCVMRQLLLERPLGTVLPASGLERRFDEICANAGLPRFRRQVDVGGHDWLGRVDFADVDIGLLIEVDSDLHHRSPADAARDALRDAALYAAGWRLVLRIPEHWIWHEPWRVVDAVRAALTENAGDRAGAAAGGGVTGATACDRRPVSDRWDPVVW